MATLTPYAQLTLWELAKRIDPKGNLQTIAEVLNQNNEILLDAVWLEANEVTSNLITKRIYLPTGSWRRVNAGVATEASLTTQVRETIGMLESYSECDKQLVEMAPDPTGFRMSEARAFLEGMSQTLAATVIYGNSNTDAEKFTGLAPRMPSLSATTNVIGAGGTGTDVTSIFIVQWGPNRVHLHYPKGSKTLGISHTDLGEVTKVDASNLMWQVYRDHFKMDVGLSIRDERCIARYCNIERSGTTGIFDEDEVIRLMNRMPDAGGGSVLYVNADIKTQMEIALKDKTNVNFSQTDGLGGVPVLRFRGCPVRKVDQILYTETALT